MIFGACATDTLNAKVSPDADFEQAADGGSEDIPPSIGLEEVPGLGAVLRSVRPTGPLVVCLHGRGGSAEGWQVNDKGIMVENLVTAGYSVICPTSIDRNQKLWSGINRADNPDIQRIDGLLEYYEVSVDRELLLLGHSMGGAMATRYAGFGHRIEQLVGVQISHAAGLQPVLDDSIYIAPTLFTYAQCDQVVDFTKIETTIQTLEDREIDHKAVLLDEYYSPGDTCHEFVETSEVFLDYFGRLEDR